MAMLAAGTSVVSALGSIQSGRAQAAGYNLQARQAELGARRSSLQYKDQGVKVLEKLNANLATVNARAGAGGLDPFSGSPLSLKSYAEKRGTQEYYLTQENAELQMITGQLQSDQFKMAGKQAKRQGVLNAISTIGMTAASLGAMGGPGAAGGNAAGGGIAGAQTSGAWIPPNTSFSPGAVAF